MKDSISLNPVMPLASDSASGAASVYGGKDAEAPLARSFRALLDQQQPTAQNGSAPSLDLAADDGNDLPYQRHAIAGSSVLDGVPGTPQSGAQTLSSKATPLKNGIAPHDDTPYDTQYEMSESRVIPVIAAGESDEGSPLESHVTGRAENTSSTYAYAAASNLGSPPLLLLREAATLPDSVAQSENEAVISGATDSALPTATERNAGSFGLSSADSDVAHQAASVQTVAFRQVSSDLAGMDAETERRVFSTGSSTGVASSPTQALPAMSFTPPASALSAASADSTLTMIDAMQSNTDVSGMDVLELSPLEVEFADDMTAQLRVMARDGHKEARLQLHPAELGRVLVSISTDGDSARINFVAETGHGRDAIEVNLPRLREMLESAGMQLGQLDVEQQALARHDHERSAEEDAGGAAELPLPDDANQYPALESELLVGSKKGMHGSDRYRVDTYI